MTLCWKDRGTGDQAGGNRKESADQWRFSDETSRWGINTNDGQTATTVVTHGGIVFHVINPGVYDWDVQLNQHGFTLEKDVNIV